MTKLGETPARKQKGDEYRLTLDEKQLFYYRLHPIEAVNDIFGIDLIWLQRITFRQMWFKRYALLNMGRGVGKTFLVSLYATLRALLFPNERIGVIAPVFRQSGFVFDEMEGLLDRSQYFLASLKKGKISRSMSAYRCDFYNGSYIEALPLGQGDKVRGRRYSIAILDEYAQLDESIIKLVIRPMLNIKIAGRENRLIIASTAYYKWNHYWTQYVYYRKMESSQEKKYHYFVAEFDYRDILMVPDSPYTVDMDIINMQKEDSMEEDFAMENLCSFPNETAGFFTSLLIEKCTPRAPRATPVELEVRQDKKEQPDAEYVMGVDCARAEGGDNFVCSILKLDKGARKMVHVHSENGKTYQEMTNITRKKVKYFNIVRIHIGTKGGGSTLKDLLAEDHLDVESGETFPALLDMEDDAHKQKDGLHMIKMVEESAPKNHEMYHRIKSDLQHNRVLFPIDIRRDVDPEIEELGQEIVKTKREMQVITANPRGMYHKFEVPKGKFKKDRVTALVLANDAAHELQNQEEAHGDVDLAVGFWA